MTRVPFYKQNTVDLGRGAFGRGGADSQPGPQSPREKSLQELKKLLGPLVNPLLRDGSGALDLSRVSAGSFAEFREFLQTQVSLDGKSFNQFDLEIGGAKIGLSAYHKVLAKEKYTPLLQMLQGQDGDKDSHEALLREFTAEIVAVSADRFVSQHIQTGEGRDRLRSILRDRGYFNRDIRADVLKAIANVGEELKVSKIHWEGINDAISVWNYWNIGVTKKEVNQAQHHARLIFSELDRLDQDHAALQRASISLSKHSGMGNPLSQLQSKLVRFKAALSREDLWGETKPSHFEEKRSYLLRRSQALIEKSQWVVDEATFQQFFRELQDFLQGPLPGEGEGAWQWLRHKVLGAGLAKFFEEAPAILQSPHEELVRLADQWHHAQEMGEKIWDPDLAGPYPVPGAGKLKAASTSQRVFEQAKSRLVQGLQQTQWSLYHGYKQHKLLSRAGSQVAKVMGQGDIVDIEKANAHLDKFLKKASRANHPGDLEKVVGELYASLKKEGVLHRALAAAEMDGVEQLIGLGQTVGILLGTVALTGGAGALGQGLSLSQQAAYGFSMGAWISLAENGIAVSSGEVRQGPDTLLRWGKDSLSTGISMALVTPLLARSGAVLEKNVLKQLGRRYFSEGARGWARIPTDALMEGVEELTDATLRSKMDGRRLALSWDQVREISVISALGGAKMGALAQGMSWARAPSVRTAGETRKSEISEEIIPLTTKTSGEATVSLNAMAGTFPVMALGEAQPGKVFEPGFDLLNEVAQTDWRLWVNAPMFAAMLPGVVSYQVFRGLGRLALFPTHRENPKALIAAKEALGSGLALMGESAVFTGALLAIENYFGGTTDLSPEALQQKYLYAVSLLGSLRLGGFGLKKLGSTMEDSQAISPTSGKVLEQFGRYLGIGISPLVEQTLQQSLGISTGPMVGPNWFGALVTLPHFMLADYAINFLKPGWFKDWEAAMYDRVVEARMPKMSDRAIVALYEQFKAQRELLEEDLRVKPEVQDEEIVIQEESLGPSRPPSIAPDPIMQKVIQNYAYPVVELGKAENRKYPRGGKLVFARALEDEGGSILPVLQEHRYVIEKVTDSGRFILKDSEGNLLRVKAASAEPEVPLFGKGNRVVLISAIEGGAPLRGEGSLLAKTFPRFHRRLVDLAALSAVLMTGGIPPFGLGGSKKSGSVASTIEEIKNSKESVAHRVERLTKLQFEIREARASSKFVREIAQHLPKLFKHRSPRIGEAARLAYLEAVVKLPPKSTEIHQAAKTLGQWVFDKSLPASVRYGAMYQYLPLLMRLPKGHPEIGLVMNNIFVDLAKTKTLTEAKRQTLPVLERLARRLGDGYSQLGKIVAKLQALSQAVSWDDPSQARLNRFIKRLQRRYQKLHHQARGTPAQAPQVFQEVLEGLLSESFNTRRETLNHIGPLYQDIQWQGLRMKFLIEVGILGQRAPLSNWEEFASTLQDIREGMDPNDADLVDLGIGLSVHGDQHLEDFGEKLVPSEAAALQYHLAENYFRFIPSEEVTTAEIPGAFFKIYERLQERTDFKIDPLIEDPPSFAEAHAREVIQYLPEDISEASSEQIESLIELASQGSPTAEQHLQSLLETSPLARDLYEQRPPSLPPPVEERPAQDSFYPNPVLQVLEDLTHKKSKFREEARKQIVPTWEKLETLGDQLHFVVELGKRSHGPKLAQWKGLEETLQFLRDRMNPKDVLLADLGITGALDGNDWVVERLKKMEAAELEDLRVHVLENYLNGRASEEDLLLAPKIIKLVWTQLEDQSSFDVPDSGDVFGLVPFWGIDHLLGVSESLNLDSGLLGMALTGLGLAALGVVKSKVSEAQLVAALEKHDGNQKLASEELPITFQAVSLRIQRAKEDSPLAKFKRGSSWYQSRPPKGLSDEKIAEILEQFDGNRQMAARELPFSKETLSKRISKAGSDSPLAKFKGHNILSDEMIARALEKYNGNQTKASREIPLSQQNISKRVALAGEDSPLARFKRRGRGRHLIPMGLGFGVVAEELFRSSEAHALVPGWVQAASHSGVENLGNWGLAALALGGLMAALKKSGKAEDSLASFLAEQLRLSPDQLTQQYPYLPQGLEFLSSLASEKGWTQSQQEQFLISNHLWLSEPNLVERAMPILRDSDLGFKSLMWIFSFREKGRGSIDLAQEMEGRAIIYQSLKGLKLGEKEKVDFYTRWNLAWSDKIKPPNFDYQLSAEIFSALKALDQKFEGMLKEGDPENKQGHLRRSYARFLTSFGQYQRAWEVFAPVEGEEIIFPEQKRPILKAQMAEHFFASKSHVEIETNGKYPREDYFWQREISNAMGDIPAFEVHEVYFPLNRVIPYHYLGHARDHESFIDTINQIRKGWLFDLMLQGWEPGSPVPVETLKRLMTSIGGPRYLPMISGENKGGYALVRDGHHRLSTLISLVADGIFPPETLTKVPLGQAPEVKPSMVINRVFTSPQYLPRFSWADVLQFHNPSVASAPRLGLNAGYDRLIDED